MQFVTALQVIQNAFTNTKTDTNLIKTTFIEQVQLSYLKPVLTEDLYDLIVTENNASSLSAANQTLFDTYIVPAMYWFVKYAVMTDVNYKSNSKGVTRGFGDYADSSDSNEMAAVMTHALSTGWRVLERMTEYIEDNDTDYPTYESGDNVLNSVNWKGGIIY